MYKRQDFGEKCREIDTAVSDVRGQGQHNKNKIEEIQKREIAKISEELEVINNRPPIILQYQHMDNREVINLKQYRRNPMEFLERVDLSLIHIYKINSDKSNDTEKSVITIDKPEYGN